MEFESMGPMPQHVTTKTIEKKNLYSLKLKLLSNKFKKINKNDNGILIDLKESVNNLKLINKINSTSRIEVKLYRSSTIPANIDKEKRINQYKFFGTMIGLIDGILDDINHDIEFELHFVDPNSSSIRNNEDLNRLFNQKEEFLEYRNLVLNDYKEYAEYIYPEILNKTINDYPAHKHFSKYFDEAFARTGQAEFISFYSNGYSQNIHCDFMDIYTQYRNLFDELITLKNELKSKVENAKRK